MLGQSGQSSSSSFKGAIVQSIAKYPLDLSSGFLIIDSTISEILIKSKLTA